MNHQTIQKGMIKILPVEDEAVIAISQKAILESLNFQVNIVNSGEKAIEYIRILVNLFILTIKRLFNPGFNQWMLNIKKLNLSLKSSYV